eukprot:1137110-Pleurochrysis_carterae.AAC.1
MWPARCASRGSEPTASAPGSPPRARGACAAAARAPPKMTRTASPQTPPGIDPTAPTRGPSPRPLASPSRGPRPPLRCRRRRRLLRALAARPPAWTVPGRRRRTQSALATPTGGPSPARRSRVPGRPRHLRGGVSPQCRRAAGCARSGWGRRLRTHGPPGCRRCSTRCPPRGRGCRLRARGPGVLPRAASSSTRSRSRSRAAVPVAVGAASAARTARPPRLPGRGPRGLPLPGARLWGRPALAARRPPPPRPSAGPEGPARTPPSPARVLPWAAAWLWCRSPPAHREGNRSGPSRTTQTTVPTHTGTRGDACRGRLP